MALDGVLYISAASGVFHTQILHIHATVAHDMLSLLDLQSRNYHLAIHLSIEAFLRLSVHVHSPDTIT